jgi:hypothetical protein
MKLDEFLPIWQFNEVHTVVVDAPPGQVFTAMKELTSAELSPLIFWMLDLRGLPAKLVGNNTPTAPQSGPFLAQFYQGGFIPLAEDSGKEIVFGLIGQFWKLTFGEEPYIPSAEAFLTFIFHVTYHHLSAIMIGNKVSIQATPVFLRRLI